MSDPNVEKTDPVTIKVIDHLIIKDKDTGEILVNKRDIIQVVDKDEHKR